MLQGVPVGGMPPPEPQPVSDDEERTGTARLVVPPPLLAAWAVAATRYRHGVAARDARDAEMQRMVRALLDSDDEG